MKGRDQWDRKSVFQIDIDIEYDEFWRKQFYFQPKRYAGWFHQIWLAEKLDRDWNLWTWFGKTYFVEINLSSVKGSGFEILINWLSALAVVGNSWANFFIKKSEASLNSSGERWQKQFLSGWRGQIQDLYCCASFQNTNTELRKHLYRSFHVSLGTSHICQRIVISCDMGHVILMLSHITPMFSPRLSVTNVRLATWCGIIWISHPPNHPPTPNTIKYAAIFHGDIFLSRNIMKVVV